MFLIGSVYFVAGSYPVDSKKVDNGSYNAPAEQIIMSRGDNNDESDTISESISLLADYKNNKAPDIDTDPVEPVSSIREPKNNV
jgi:hypothetical protein